MPNIYEDWNKYTAWIEWMYKCDVPPEVVQEGLIALLTREVEKENADDGTVITLKMI